MTVTVNVYCVDTVMVALRPQIVGERADPVSLLPADEASEPPFGRGSEPLLATDGSPDVVKALVNRPWPGEAKLNSSERTKPVSRVDDWAVEVLK